MTNNMAINFFMEVRFRMRIQCSVFQNEIQRHQACMAGGFLSGKLEVAKNCLTDERI